MDENEKNTSMCVHYRTELEHDLAIDVGRNLRKLGYDAFVADVSDTLPLDPPAETPSVRVSVGTTREDAEAQVETEREEMAQSIADGEAMAREREKKSPLWVACTLYDHVCDLDDQGGDASFNGDPETAYDCFGKELVLSQIICQITPTCQSYSDVALARSEMGDALMSMGQLSAALYHYQNALRVAERVARTEPKNAERQVTLAEYNIDVAEVLRVLGFLDEAQAYASHALDALMQVVGKAYDNADEYAARYQVARCANGIGVTNVRRAEHQIRTDQVTDAYEILDQTIADFDFQRDIAFSVVGCDDEDLAEDAAWLCATAAYWRGFVELELGRFDDAHYDLSTALAEFTAMGQDDTTWAASEVSQVYKALGDLLWQQADEQGALRYYEHSLKVARSNLVQFDLQDDLADLVEELVQVAQIKRSQGKLDEARNLCAEAIDLLPRMSFESVRTVPAALATYAEAASVEDALGHADEATRMKQLRQQALKQAKTWDCDELKKHVSSMPDRERQDSITWYEELKAAGILESKPDE